MRGSPRGLSNLSFGSAGTVFPPHLADHAFVEGLLGSLHPVDQSLMPDMSLKTRASSLWEGSLHGETFPNYFPLKLLISHWTARIVVRDVLALVSNGVLEPGNDAF